MSFLDQHQPHTVPSPSWWCGRWAIGERPGSDQILFDDLLGIGGLLISGPTGSGKSELVSSMIRQVESLNTSDTIQFWLVNTEADRSPTVTRHVPQSLVTGKSPDGYVGLVSDLLDVAVATIRERSDLRARHKSQPSGIQEAHELAVSEVTDLPRAALAAHPLYYPRIVVVIEEVGLLIDGANTPATKDRAKRIVDAMSLISRRGRADGVHLVWTSRSEPGKVVNPLPDAEMRQVRLATDHGGTYSRSGRYGISYPFTALPISD